ncbi:MAG TPA: hypothetical protein VF951_02945, partial [Streptosporangiaceae bacterium]
MYKVPRSAPPNAAEVTWLTGGADRVAGVEPGVRAGGRIERVHVAGQDVHPAEQPARRVPDWALGQLALGRDRDLGGQGPGGHSALTSRMTLPLGPEADRSTS